MIGGLRNGGRSKKPENGLRTKRTLTRTCGPFVWKESGRLYRLIDHMQKDQFLHHSFTNGHQSLLTSNMRCSIKVYKKETWEDPHSAKP